MDLIVKLLSKFLMFFGELGSSQMCFGYLHEVEVPKELQEDL